LGVVGITENRDRDEHATIAIDSEVLDRDAGDVGSGRGWRVVRAVGHVEAAHVRGGARITRSHCSELIVVGRNCGAGVGAGVPAHGVRGARVQDIREEA